jgi:hypothetical protein
VGAGLDDPAVLHHDDAVRRARLGEAVRDDERGAVGRRRAGRLVEGSCARAAGLGGRLVEDGDARVLPRQGGIEGRVDAMRSR